MKEFDFEEAKKGAPVCTRDGRDVKILDYDYHRVDGDEHFIIAKYPAMSGRGEVAVMYTQDGKMYHGDDDDKDKDLMMVSKKHEGWANILVGSACKSDLNRYFSGIFSTKKEAQKYNTDNIVDCVKIEWEE